MTSCLQDWKALTALSLVKQKEKILFYFAFLHFPKMWGLKRHESHWKVEIPLAWGHAG